jgi:hypothetical protein
MKMTTNNISALLSGMESFNNVMKGKYSVSLIACTSIFAPHDMSYSLTIDKGDERIYSNYHVEETGACASALAEMLVIVGREAHETEEALKKVEEKLKEGDEK